MEKGHNLNTFKLFCDKWVSVQEFRRLWIRKRQITQSKSDSAPYVCKLNKQQVNPWPLTATEVSAFFPGQAENMSTDWNQFQCDNVSRASTVHTKFHITLGTEVVVYRVGDFVVQLKDGTFHKASGSWCSMVIVGKEGSDESIHDIDLPGVGLGKPRQVLSPRKLLTFSHFVFLIF
eukprot:TRINITY_DN2539_c0_g1_i3.p1 TRINITY_DN2539_c0_g1~~TRINITY_DN2539_c0_g1_i3.p1  ORF type:complete len:176 (-),score=23.99 TRINITY_DN2539_c0_g1_i3:54-581(-)